MRSFFDVRPFLPIDLPLVRRLTPQGIGFDSATSLTRGIHTLEGAVWGSVPLGDLGTPTFVLRSDENDYVAQFRHRTGEQHAYIVFVAPDLEHCGGDSAWLQLLDAMVSAAGRRGALTLNAEVGETTAEFAVLRQSGFAVYARQEIWKREPGPVRQETDVQLRPEADVDTFGIHSLYASVVPRLVLQADAPPETSRDGLIYERDGQILAYLLAQEGKCGIYIRSFVHPEIYDQTQAILTAVLRHLPHAERLPVYFCVRRYQDWLRGSLSALDFDTWVSQAVMVRHTACRLEQAAYKPAHALDGVAPALPRSTSKLIRTGRAQGHPC
jgi:hypothetical protein